MITFSATYCPTMPIRLLPLAVPFAALVALASPNLASWVGSVVAAAAEVPGWASLLLGPLGGLAGSFCAVWWLAKRLNKVEEQATAQRQKDHETLIEILKAQTETAIRCQMAIERNTNALEHCAQRNGPPGE